MNKNYKLYNVPKIDSVQELLLRSANEYSDKLALEDLNDTPIPRLTYKELLSNVLKFGNALKDLGLEERSHVAIISENRVQWVIGYLTCMTFNYVAVPIDKNLTRNDIFNIIHESNAEAIIFSAAYSELFDDSHSALKRLKYFICMDECPSELPYLSMKKLIDEHDEYSVDQLPKINNTDLAEIIFTSGSLGRAKGVMLSQKNLASNIVDMVSMMMIYPKDRFLSVLPIHHTYECTCGTLCPIYSGASVHYARSLKTIVDDIQNVQATMFLGVPLLFEKMYKKIVKSISEDKVKSIVVPILVKVTDLLEKLNLKGSKKKLFAELHEKFGGHVRAFIAGGAAPDPQVAAGLRGFGFSFIQGYGLTETSPILALNRLDNFKDDAAGLPLPHVEIKIDSPDHNGVGEILAKGPNVMLGYYKNEEATNDVMEDDWFRTGDLGYIDSDGFLHISGRKKNLILSKSGENVFPEEIEDLLNRSKYVLECIVYGKKDEKHDEIIAAKIVPDTEGFIELSETENRTIDQDFIKEVLSKEVANVNKQLPAFKRIITFKVREEEFEKTTTQKIKRYSPNNME
ncbi:Long-chain-fatty-acid--CoA ligase [hydrothermal vent metagenome]|uniref:Long-chain-fatty-acid--CoA ligase n=1 Tax=hydrothermal vent metagenome TaxID=652676 RepID=A0A3B1DAY4_9ZZZZ